MAVKFAAGGNRFNGSLRPQLPCCSSFPHSFLASPSIIFPFLSPKRSVFNGSEFPSLPRPITTRRSVFLGTSSDKLFSASAARKSKKHFSMQRAFSAGLEFQGHNDDGEGEFVRQIQDDSNIAQNRPERSRIQEADIHMAITSASSALPLPSSCGDVMGSSDELSWPSTVPQPPAWLFRGEPVPASMEMRANSVHLPLSLRIIKRKRRREEGLFKEASESACCSIKKAFSSMVFIVGELQRYTLQMREIPFHENLQVIIARVNREMHASFVWLFQHIFSCTPTLMVYVMLLLANFTVCSITHNSAMAAVSSNPPIVSVEQEYQQTENRPQMKSFSVGRAVSVGGKGGGGGTVRPVAGATDDGQSDGSCSSSYTIRQEETPVWNRIVEEAHRMKASSINESLMDTDTLQVLVSPVTVELEADNYAEYSETEIMYHKALSQDPDNVLLISNFAQFLSLVLQDHDRAEYYFKRAVAIKPTDAEALHRYANFLWTVRKDLGAAEETYLEAIGADPSNTYYAANYAHFLWNTGGEDTCYPLDSSDAC